MPCDHLRARPDAEGRHQVYALHWRGRSDARRREQIGIDPTDPASVQPPAAHKLDDTATDGTEFCAVCEAHRFGAIRRSSSKTLRITVT
jgi:hypothetical protein